MRAVPSIQDAIRALPRYLLVLAAVSALALLARAAAPSSPRPLSVVLVSAGPHAPVAASLTSAAAGSAPAGERLPPAAVAPPAAPGSQPRR